MTVLLNTAMFIPCRRTLTQQASSRTHTSCLVHHSLAAHTRRRLRGQGHRLTTILLASGDTGGGSAKSTRQVADGTWRRPVGQSRASGTNPRFCRYDGHRQFPTFTTRNLTRAHPTPYVPKMTRQVDCFGRSEGGSAMRKSRMQKLAIACISVFAVLGGIGAANAQERLPLSLSDVSRVRCAPLHGNRLADRESVGCVRSP